MKGLHYAHYNSHGIKWFFFKWTVEIRLGFFFKLIYGGCLKQLEIRIIVIRRCLNVKQFYR